MLNGCCRATRRPAVPAFGNVTRSSLALPAAGELAQGRSPLREPDLRPAFCRAQLAHVGAASMPDRQIGIGLGVQDSGEDATWWTIVPMFIGFARPRASSAHSLDRARGVWEAWPGAP